MTDGAVENPDECIDLVTKHSESSRVFTFGLDRTASRHLVSSLARAGNGKAYHLRNCNTLCHKVWKDYGEVNECSIRTSILPS